MASLSLVYDIIARDRASSEFRKVGDAAESAGKRGSSAIGSLAGSLKVAGAAVAGSALIAGLGKTITAASDLSETVNKSNVIFGSNSREIQRWATGAARNLGLSRGAALEAAAGFGNMFSQLGFTGDAAADMSTQVVQLSADLGSFNNLPTAEVADMMSAAFRGEYDSLQRLIPNINAARVESEALAATGKTVASELTAQEKAAAVLAIVQRDGAAAAGDFARTSDGLANSQKILNAEFEDLQAKIGEKFLPVATTAVQFLSNTAIPVFEGIFDAVGGVVSAFTDLPVPVQVAIGSMAAVAALKGPFSTFSTAVQGAMETAALKTLYLRDSISSIDAARSTVRRGLSGFVGFLGGPWGLALTGAAVGLSFLAEWMGKTDEATEELTDGQRELESALMQSKGAIDANVRAAAAKAAQDAGLLDVAEDVGISLGSVTDAILRQGNSYNEVIAELMKYRDARVLGSDAERQAAASANAAITALQGLSGETDTNIGKAQQLADATDGAAAGTGGLGGAAAEAAEDVRELKTRLDDLTGVTLSAMEAEANLQDAIRDAASATDDLSGSVVNANGKLNLHTEAGSAAFRALVDLRDSSNDVIDSLREQGASAETMAKRDQKLRESFIKTAIQMGIGRQEARRLADQILGVPKDRKTEFKADTKAANTAIDNLQTNIKNTEGKTVTVQVRAAGRFIVNPNGGLQEFWKGGYTGPGGMFDVKGLVHGDEFVVPKSRVRAMGGPRAVAAAVGMGEDFGAGTIPMTLIHDTRSVERDMEAVANAVKRATPKEGVAGSGAVGGAWQSLWNYVKARVPLARINSTYRPGDPGYHGLGKAIDFGYGSGPGGAGSAGLALINRVLHDGVGRNLAELIYDGLYDDRPDLKNGRPLTYSQGTRFEHRNHVHAAVYDTGGLLPPGRTLVDNRTGKFETVRNAEQEALLHRSTSLPPIIINGVASPESVAQAVERGRRIQEYLYG